MEFELILTYILIFIITLLYGLFTYKFNYWSKRQIPYIQPQIPFGNLSGFRRKKHSSLLMKDYYDILKTQSIYGGIYFFISPVALICDVNLIRNILIKDFHNFMDRGLYYNELDDPLSAHLLSLDGKRWKRLRSKLTPTFTSGKIKFMLPTIVDVGIKFQKTLRKQLKLLEIATETDDGVQEIEIKDIIARFTTDVIGTCAFGIECNSLEDPNAEFRRMGKMVFDTPKNSGIKQLFMMIFRDVARQLHMTTTHPVVSEFFLNVVKETVQIRQDRNIKRNDFLDLLIQLSKNHLISDENDENDDQLTTTTSTSSSSHSHDEQHIDDDSTLTIEEMAAQVFLFFLAGFETSFTAMTFCLYELAVNQNIQDAARQEIHTILQKHNNQLTYDAILEMTLIDRIIYESLRKYPPASNIIRKTKNNYLVPGSDNKYIEKGTTIWIPVYGIHHDPEYYPEPEQFNPDRFLPDEIQKRPSCSFLAFGDGPRNCIGLRFGMMQARVGLISLLQNFKFHLGKRTPVPLLLSKTSFILSPEDGLWLNVEQL